LQETFSRSDRWREPPAGRAAHRSNTGLISRRLYRVFAGFSATAARIRSTEAVNRTPRLSRLRSLRMYHRPRKKPRLMDGPLRTAGIGCWESRPPTGEGKPGGGPAIWVSAPPNGSPRGKLLIRRGLADRVTRANLLAGNGRGAGAAAGLVKQAAERKLGDRGGTWAGHRSRQGP